MAAQTKAQRAEKNKEKWGKGGKKAAEKATETPDTSASGGKTPPPVPSVVETAESGETTPSSPPEGAYYPFTSNVEKKLYTDSNAIIENMPANAEIPEAPITAPVFDYNEVMDQATAKIEEREEKKDGKESEDKKEKKEESTATTDKTKEHGFIGSKEMMELPKAQKNKNAARLVDRILDAYCWAHTLTAKGCLFTEEKMKRRAMKGRFDMKLLEVEIQLSEGPDDTTTIEEFIDDYNKSIIQTLNYDVETGECTLDQAWVDEIRPILIEIFSERGWGMSKEMYVISEVVEDVLKKGAAIVSNAMVFRGILNVARQQLSEIKEANRLKAKELELQSRKPPQGEGKEGVEAVEAVETTDLKIKEA